MDLNSTNMAELFRTFNVALTEGMQASGVKLNEEDPVLDELAMVGQSMGASALHGWLGPITSMRKWIGPRIVNNVASNKLDVINEDYENTIGMPRNAIRDDQYGLYTPLIRALGIDAGNLWRKLALTALCANGKWVDGKLFFATDRTYGANTIGNLTASALSEATYEAALQALSSFVGANDEPMEVAPRYLLVGPSNRGAAWNLVKNQIVVGGTASTKFGAIQNRLQGSCELRVSRRLVGAYANYWFVLGEMSGIKPVYVQKREEPILTRKDQEADDNVFMDNQVLYGTRASGAAFLTLPHLAYAGIL